MLNNDTTFLSDQSIWSILETHLNEKNDDQIFNQICNSCTSHDIIYDHNAYICNNCGIINSEILDDSPEWNNFEDSKDNSRCSNPSNYFFPKSSFAITINSNVYSNIKRLKNWEQIPYKERILLEVFNLIDMKCKKYKIIKAIGDNTKILYNNIKLIKHINGKSDKEKLIIIRGKNRMQIIAACFYYGAILQKHPRSTKEVAEIFELTIKDITKGNRTFLKLMNDDKKIIDIKPINASEFIERFCSKIKISKHTMKLSKNIAENTYKLELIIDHQAISIAAACILLAMNITGELENKKIISKIFEISEVILTITFKEINKYPFPLILTNNDLTNKIYEILESKKKDINNIDSDVLDETDIVSKKEKNELLELKGLKEKKKCGRPKKIITLPLSL